MNDRGLQIYGIGTGKRSGLSSGVLLWGLFAGVAWASVVAGYVDKGVVAPGLVVLAVVVTIGLAIVYTGYRRTRLNC
jgi:hypothetical protein